MIDPTPLRTWTSGCWRGFGALVGLRLRTVAAAQDTQGVESIT